MKYLNSNNIDLMKLEKYINDLYFEIVSCEEISIYKDNLLEMKVNILNNYLNDVKNVLSFQKKLDKISLYTYLFTLVSLLFIGVSLYIPLLVNLISALVRVFIRKNVNQNIIDNEIEINCLEITLANCQTFLESKTTKKIDSLEPVQDDDKINVEIMANEFLQKYLNGEILQIDDNTKEVVINILKDDLGVEEQNLGVLLKLAKLKISRENLESELKLVRKNGKIDEK